MASNFNRNNGWLMSLGMSLLGPVSRSNEDGAKTLVWLATSPEAALRSGGYYHDMAERLPSPGGAGSPIIAAALGGERGAVRGRAAA